MSEIFVQYQHAGSKSRKQAEVDHESKCGLVVLGSLAEKTNLKMRAATPASNVHLNKERPDNIPTSGLPTQAEVLCNHCSD